MLPTLLVAPEVAAAGAVQALEPVIQALHLRYSVTVIISISHCLVLGEASLLLDHHQLLLPQLARRPGVPHLPHRKCIDYLVNCSSIFFPGGLLGGEVQVD